MATQKIYINGSDLRVFSNYKLCYVDEIPETYTDWDPESKKLMDTPEYKEYRAKVNKELDVIRNKRKEEEGFGYLSSGDYASVERRLDPQGKFYTDMCEYPDPDYEKGYTHYLYFTDNLEKQWGDDWDDAPYDCNAGYPYDIETDVIVIPICIEYFKLQHMVEVEDNWNDLKTTCPLYDNVEIRFPCDGFTNSPYSIDMINTGAIPWLYARICRRKIVNPHESISVMAGEDPESVVNKICKFNKMMYTKD